ncbi:ATP-grasp domain-containing protein [Kineosporia succinea]|uniref:ATP-grasp domain-containing protein n=1 Tax=Kineosporia succinea TaxID=84632 RepID=A0ABT9PBX2_9ACTN|nr:hypothetical protein [Kineosporia succinea]MDP9830200.1 hypothetical protein [Kineosporia succinea]
MSDPTDPTDPTIGPTTGLRPRLAVVYDQGPASPSDLAVSLTERMACIFVVPVNAHTEAVAPVLASFGEVVRADDVARTAQRLREFSVAGIVTYTEQVQRLTADLAARLGLRFHSPRTAELLTDKWQQRAVLRAAGIDAVRSARVDALADWEPALSRVGLPAVLKPVHGAASGNTYLVADAGTGRELARQVLSLPAPGHVRGGGLVLEEYLPGRDCAPFGDYVSVESAVRDSRVTDIAVTGKLPMVPPFRETGRFWPSPFPAPENDRIRDLAGRAVRALGVRDGLTHTEVKLTPDGPRLIEVNGRLGGGIQDLAQRAMGLDLIEYAARIALGEPAPPRIVPVGQVYFQAFHPAPRRPATVRGHGGTEAVRALEGVQLCRTYVRPGQRLAGGVATQELGRVSGVVADHDALATLVKRVDQHLTFEFALSGEPEPRTVTRAELGSL